MAPAMWLGSCEQPWHCKDASTQEEHDLHLGLHMVAWSGKQEKTLFFTLHSETQMSVSDTDKKPCGLWHNWKYTFGTIFWDCLQFSIYVT